jgi:[histone H3]-dimethyl-L-lysine9 demethylase
MCRLCGREACAECYEQVQELTDDRGAEDADVLELQARREKHARRNPFFLSCTRRNEHQAKDFSPMSRFCKTELEQAIQEMEDLLSSPDSDGDSEQIPDTSVVAIEEIAKEQNHPDDSTNPDSRPLEDLPLVSSPGSSSEIPSHVVTKYHDQDLRYDAFRKLWAKGEPLVVTGLLEKFQIKWSPDYFIEHYYTQSCLVIECQSDVNKRVTVGEFFQDFGKYEGRRDTWKLKVDTSCSLAKISSSPAQLILN